MRWITLGEKDAVWDIGSANPSKLQKCASAPLVAKRETGRLRSVVISNYLLANPVNADDQDAIHVVLLALRRCASFGS